MDMKVIFGAVDGLSVDINQRATGIQTRLDDMDAELQQLKENWEGEAQAAYLVAKEEWTAGMVALREILNRISGSVSDSSGLYRGADNANANEFRG